MYSLSQLRRQVDSLMRKYAVELAEFKLRPFANEYCDQWEELVAEDKLPPDPRRLFKKLPGQDFLRRYFPAVNNYLEDCRQARRLPHPNEILRFLIPKAIDRGLIPKRPAPTVPY